jgi:2-polyprenyl-3-methyl-5-hydroxy-6-metoxy-1,4-benzoquinol methylase
LIHNNKSYKSLRTDLLQFVESPKSLLDVGCNEGILGLYIKENIHENIHVSGIDYNPKTISIAKKRLDIAEVVNLNNQQEIGSFLKKCPKYDHIIFGDILEHLTHPLEALDILSKQLLPNGKMIISIPNTNHYSSLLNFFSLKWPRNERGIYDKTHLRIFMLRNINELAPNGFKVQKIKRKYRLFESRSTILDKAIAYPLNFIPYFRECYFKVIPKKPHWLP